MIVVWSLLLAWVAVTMLCFARCSRYERALIEISHAHEGDSVKRLSELAHFARGWKRWPRRSAE